MALSLKIGSFTTNGTTGNQSVTGVGFTPQLVIFLGHQSTSIPNTTTYMRQAVGCMDDSGNQWSMVHGAEDSSGTSNTARYHYNNRALVTAGQTIGLEFSYVSMDADGFTVNIDNALARDVVYLAIGGLDNALVGTFDSATSTGTQDITTLGFQPDAVILSASFCSSANTKTDWVRGSLGFDDATNHRVHAHFDADNKATTETDKGLDDDYALKIFSNWASPDQEAYVTSMLSNGFRLQWDTADGTARKCGFIAFDGVDVDIGSIQAKSTTGTQAYTGVGFQPELLFLLGFNGAADGTSVDAERGFGFTTGASSNGAIGDASEDAVGTTNVARALSDADCVYVPNFAGSGLAHEAILSSFDSDGFTLNWQTVSGSQEYWFYMALKDEAAVPAGDPRNLLLLGAGPGGA